MSSSIQDLIPQNTLRDTFGPLFIGVTVAAVLFGISNVQALVYFQTHMSTGITFYKLVVICLWVLDAVHLALVIHCVYSYLVLEYANITALTEILQIIFDFFITHGAHLMYVYRIWIVSKGRSKALPITVGIVVILGSGIAIAVISSIYQCHVFADLVRIDWSTYMSGTGIACFRRHCHCIIAMLSSHYLPYWVRWH
ncbi:hypothetical protein DFH29DRAFT_251595 [Suillus ampliporus]|nr:hypothetical protein DFH29DRAFT_251595 [Suillus ampliporus]